MKKITASLIITLALSSPALLWAQEITFTLEEAVAIAVRDNRDILIKAEDVKNAKFKIAEAQASLFPSLDFTGSWTRSKGRYDKDITQTPTQTGITQYLYKGGSIINTIKYNGYNFEIAQTALDKTKLELILNVQKAFYTLLLSREFAGLNRDIADNTKAHLYFVKERYKSGQASESDVLKAEASLDSVDQAYKSSLNQVKANQVLLNNLMYLDKDTDIAPSAAFAYEAAEVAFDEAFLKAMRDRPEIKQYELQQEADKKAVEIAKAGGRPSVYAAADYYTQSSIATATGAAENWNDYSVIGLTVSWPIFDGWATKAKVEQAMTDLKASRLLREKTVNDIALELKNAYLALKNSISKIHSTESDIRFYGDNLSTIKQKCAEGITSSLDLSDAELKYGISQFNKNQAVYDYIVAKSSFDKAMGGL